MSKREVILPDLQPLTPKGKEMLLRITDTYARSTTNGVPNRKYILHYLETGEVTLEELPLLHRVPEIRQWLVDELEAWLHPVDPEEQAIQAALRTNLPTTPEKVKELMPEQRSALAEQLEAYVKAYNTEDDAYSYRPQGNMVDEALRYLDAIYREENRVKEAEEWERVDKRNYLALLTYFRDHPSTSYSAELDDCLWAIVSARPINLEQVRRFMTDFPRSIHYRDADEIIQEYDEWDRIQKSDLEGKLERVNEYWMRHKGGVFAAQAFELRNYLKEERLKEIKEKIAKYGIADLENWVTQGLFTEQEIIDTGLATEEALAKLRNKSKVNPDLDLSKTQYVCPEGATDVFFFGIPNTGKTCVLMGLLKKNPFFNPIKAGGEYGEDLVRLCDAGVPPTRTLGDFATLIKSKILDAKGNEHLVNFIDMAGEGFADKIARNPVLKDNETMPITALGPGIPQMLTNSNDKVFFIVVDPTTDIVKFRKVTESGSSELEVSQKETIRRLVAILSDSANEEIMKRVKAIHFIATKADCLGERAVRQSKAVGIINTRYDDIIPVVAHLCKTYEINGLTKFRPKLFSFSLGRFYFGGVFDYDSIATAQLLAVITKLTVGTRKVTLWDRFRHWVNK